MSATNRGSQRLPDDAYMTPQWCVTSLLNRISLPSGNWLEPAAGSGNIINSVNQSYNDISWEAVDVRDDACSSLRSIPNIVSHCDDFLRPKFSPCLHPNVIITNPPFSLALEFIQHSLQLTDGPVIMLLRLNWLASKKRAAFLQHNTPDVYVLPKRPQFCQRFNKKTQKWVNGSDATDYAWFVWPSRIPRQSGSISILNT